ncbi:hypothetical protein BCR33DRAFT_725478 [Rhizoclosmatium globosum]|uniref:Uncharacterized protein n=1 Tax=Rhizoclosmatium globosum TaxID=329046 RepID=A0A1Y2AYQ8_9FUNG|nr:hypothetical protein BCR33DRAFT_725478 [Rhizoclosmatium globosum]|eukprot:ORY27604.1 hypothetical protein BCR33DRAFT_725478 [Rhizoclosmatium globosum]
MTLKLGATTHFFLSFLQRVHDLKRSSGRWSHASLRRMQLVQGPEVEPGI